MATGVDAPRVLAERNEVLSRAEFHYGKSWFEEYVVPVLQSILEWFAGLPRPLYWLLLAMLLLVLVLLMAHVISGITEQSRGAGRSGRGAPGTATGPARGSTSLDDAQAAVAAGRFPDAVRLAWLAALARLDAAGVSEARAGRADFEHVRAARSRAPQAVGAVESLAALFARVRWGGLGVGEPEARRSLDLARAVASALPGEPEARAT